MAVAPPRLDDADLAALPDPLVDPPGFLTAAAAHGDVVGYRAGGQERVLLAHPDDVHEVLTRWPEEARRTAITRTAAAVIGDGLITAEAPHWAPRRHVVQRELTHRRVGRFAERIAANTERHVDRWAGRGRVDLQDAVGRLTLDNLGDTVFGQGFEGVRDRLVHALRTSQLSIDAVLAERFGDAERMALAEATRNIHDVVAGLVADHRSAPDATDDLLRVLIDRADTGEPPFREPWLRDEAVTLIMAGHETTGFATTLALHLLAQHPEELRRLRTELTAATARGVPAGALVEEVPRARHVVQETLRLFPPLPALHRTALEDAEFQGFGVPAGTMVVTGAWVVHRDPRWWPEPERFDPDRWSDARRRAHVRYAYLPFGAGRRVCAGNHFALLQAATIVAVVALRARLAPVPGAGPVLVDHGTALTCAEPLLVDVARAGPEPVSP